MASADEGTKPKYPVGSKVLVFGKHVGTVKYFGKIPTRVCPQIYGVDLEKAVGYSDGTPVSLVEKKKTIDSKSTTSEQKKFSPAFKCGKDRGVFAASLAVIPYSKEHRAATIIQSKVRSVRVRRKVKAMLLQKAWNTLDSDAENIALDLGKKTFSAAEEALEKRRESWVSQSTDGEMEIKVEADYKGPRFAHLDKGKVHLKEVLELLRCFKSGGTLHAKYAMQIIEAVTKIYADQPTVQELPLPEGTKMTIVGDLHGQLKDLFTIFTINGLPTRTNQYFFNGDFVDRGYYGVEIVLIIFSFKLVYPDAVHMNRGNHECRQQNAYMGFEDEVLYKYDGSDANDTNRAWRIYDAFHDAFQALPLAATLGKKVAIMHGGLFGRKGITFKHINAIERKREPPLEGSSLQDQLFEQILWSDPRPTSHFPVAVRWWKPSDRGAGVEFGVEMTNQFCRRNKVALIIRSHECVQDGYEVLHGGRLITIFSASHYCQKNNNKGAFITFTHKMEPEIQQFVAHDASEFKIPELNDDASSSSSASKTEDGVGTKSAKDKAKERDRMLKDMVRMISERIISHKVDLYWWYMQCEQVSDGCVSVVDWASGIRDCLELELPLLVHREHLVDLEADGSVNYVRFLKAHRVVHKDKSWQRDMIHRICEKLYKHSHSFKAAYDFMDKDADGFIQFKELRNSLEQLKCGLKQSQVYELMQALDVSEDNKVSFDEFRDLFQVEFTLVMKQEHQVQFQEMIDTVGRLLFERSKSASRRPSRAMSAAFKDIGAASKDSEMSYKEFASGIANLLGDKSPPVSGLEKLAAAIDLSRNGKIDIDEFVAAFQIKLKSEDGKRLTASVLDGISTVLYQHKKALVQYFRRVDERNSGHVTAEVFVSGVRTINESLKEPITDAQIDYLVQILDTKGTGEVHYQDFLNAFQLHSPQESKAFFVE